ncbi:MAG TPA: hypothetical protein VH120_05195, partial [Gemmataceae bacterium]|nr:hypothetical protein [Gemmataceae bacterium]
NRKRLDKPAEKALARQQQESINKAVENLKVPGDNAAAQRDRQQAAELAAEAARALNRDDAMSAEFRMGQAKEALDRLADNLPTAENRLRRARDEVARLRQTQEEIGRQADKAARAPEKGDRQAAADERADAARKQADVADRLSKLDTPGQEARQNRATQAAARAEDDLQNPKSADVTASQADSRRALERLAEALAGQTPADVKARDLARQERDLANDIPRKAADPAGQLDLQRRQQKIAEETQALKATEASVRHGEATQAAIQANAAVRDKPDDLETLQKVHNAADKLEALADQLAGKESETERADRLAKKQEAAAKQPAADRNEARRQANQIASEAQQIRAGEQAAAAKQQAVDALSRLQRTAPETPDNAQAQQAAADALRRLADQMKQQRADTTPTPRPEDLARQQRELARETDAARKQSDANSKLQRLSDRQQQLRQQANRLPTDQAPRAVQQARQAMQQAEQALARQDATQAAQRQRQAADELENAGRQMAPSSKPAQGDQQTPDGMPTPAQVAQAREMANRQRELQDQVRRATSSESATAEEKAAANRRQQELANQAGDLAKSLDQSAGNMPGQEAKQSARAAAAAARQGEQAIQKSQAGDANQSKQARRQAAEALDRAARQAEQSARMSHQPGQPNGSPQAGQQVQKAQGQMKQAQNQLGQGQAQQAGGSMQQAANSLQQAARQMGQRGEPQGPREGGRPAEVATQGKGTPTAAELPKDLEKYAGKKWGELPGELRTRIVQEMKAQYGDDYARVIKLYFEQIAENNGKK